MKLIMAANVQNYEDSNGDANEEEGNGEGAANN